VPLPLPLPQPLLPLLLLLLPPLLLLLLVVLLLQTAERHEMGTATFVARGYGRYDSVYN
jgi:cytochrome c oxidase subunit IV